MADIQWHNFDCGLCCALVNVDGTTGSVHHFCKFVATIMESNGVISVVTGPKLTKFLYDVEGSSPLLTRQSASV